MLRAQAAKQKTDCIILAIYRLTPFRILIYVNLFSIVFYTNVGTKGQNSEERFSALE